MNRGTGNPIGNGAKGDQGNEAHQYDIQNDVTGQRRSDPIVGGEVHGRLSRLMSLTSINVSIGGFLP